MRYTPDTETPPAQPSAEVSRQKGIWGVRHHLQVSSLPLLGPCGQGSSSKSPSDQTLETVDMSCSQEKVSEL